jgi:general stress protein 26
VFAIDDELQSYVESGVAVVAATADAEGRPHMTYAWGPRVGKTRSHLTVFIEPSRGAQPLLDIASGGAIAVTFGHPTTYRSVQLKGRVTSVEDASAADLAWVDRHRDDFLSSTSLVGDDPATIRGSWAGDLELRRVEIEVERAFDQTPGPDAGKPL